MVTDKTLNSLMTWSRHSNVGSFCLHLCRPGVGLSTSLTLPCTLEHNTVFSFTESVHITEDCVRSGWKNESVEIKA